MNRRIKKKRMKIYSTAKQRRKNKKLCERYPFLIPRSVWTDEIIWDRYKDTKKWSSTLAEDFPKGWWKAFGKMMCEELREDLIKCNYLDEFRFEQIKEKFGELRAYTNCIPQGSDAANIIDKYTYLSSNICICCGRPDVPMVNESWISPECFVCYYKRQIKRDKYFVKRGMIKQIRTWGEIRDRYNELTRCNDTKMADSITCQHYSIAGDWIETIDISDTANAIRERWKKLNE